MSNGDEVARWVARAPEVPEAWFLRRGPQSSRVHGVTHTQRVHIHAQRLTEVLAWDEGDAALVLRAALVHDIGRRDDGVDPWHGATSASRAEQLGLLDDLSSEEAAVMAFAVRYHSRTDERAVRSLERPDAADDRGRDGARHADPVRALRVLWLLKDADALDRVRLHFPRGADPDMLRHRETVDLMPFAVELYRAFPD